MAIDSLFDISIADLKGLKREILAVYANQFEGGYEEMSRFIDGESFIYSYDFNIL